MEKLTKIVSLRFDPVTYEALKKCSDLKGIGLCNCIRESVRRELARLGMLSPEECAIVLGTGMNEGGRE